MDNLKIKIAGEISLSDSPGSAMKKWRELFGITQIELAKTIKVSTSTISDYESNRRLSPGVAVIRRFVDALFLIDEEKGSLVKQNLERFATESGPENPTYKLHDFVAPISGMDFSRIIEGKIVANPNYIDNIKLFGYTIIDSLKIILEMSPSEYPKLFGSTTERVFIFEHVSSGRSPMVVIRVAPIKPRLVVLHNIINVDKLAIKIAQVEKIPLITTKLDIKSIEERLNKI
ncbi:MAG: helix-turn-helix domain-containing protein [Candidatus Marsarchaeota archaeon]|jgi:putative transcriptional regulator|nr:helix-turn-helix domain-containing protein [Candidatus Marsarchaeota archaeon]